MSLLVRAGSVPCRNLDIGVEANLAAVKEEKPKSIKHTKECIVCESSEKDWRKQQQQKDNHTS